MNIKIQNLYKNYESDAGAVTPVLYDINLEIPHGEPVVLFGESGAGKSTLLHILGTLENPTQGHVFFDEEDVFSRSERELADFRNHYLGFIFQAHHLLPDFNTLENVAMPLLIRGEDRTESLKKALYWLDQVGLEDKKDRRSNELSGGEQQRVAIARALVGDPKIILADEPTGNLDEENGEKIFNKLLQMNKDLGASLVVATHNKKFISKFDRKVEIIDGKINS